LKQADPIKHQEMMSEINQLVENVAHELDATGQTTSEHVARNQDLLTQLSVSHPKIDLIVKIAKDHGLSGKLTGAGGGGCVFIYIPQNTENEIVEKLKSRLVETGLNKLWDITLGGEGFHIK
jgi:mevalonate kinase